MNSYGNDNDVMNEFHSIVSDAGDLGVDIVTEWRQAHMGNSVAAIQLISTGIHLIDCELDFDERRLSVVTEMGDVIDFGFTDAGEASAFENLIDMGEAEVLTATVDGSGNMGVSVTDGEIVLVGHFDCLAVTSFGFFEN